MQFPRVPSDPFASVGAADAARSLDDIAEWRPAFIAWLRDAGTSAVSTRLSMVLLELLDASATSSYARYPYRLTRFPAVLQGTDPVLALQRVLLWRAGVVDFLSDVWDTVDAGIDIEECGRLETLLMPVGMSGVCPLCLASVAPDQGLHFESCAVQQAWARMH